MKHHRRTWVLRKCLVVVVVESEKLGVISGITGRPEILQYVGGVSPGLLPLHSLSYIIDLIEALRIVHQ